jgi:hypothetical protein
MPNIKRAIYRYDIMAKRFEESGVCPNQAKVYREMSDFIKDCADMNEATKKMKGSKYYTAPSRL